MIKKSNLTHTEIKKITRNISWLFFDKFLKMGVGVFVVILMARYLGPERFGLFNFTIALITIFSAFSALGLNGIVTRDLVVNENKKQIFAAAFSLRLLSSSIAYLALIITIFLLRADDVLAKSLTVIMGFTLFFRVGDIIKYWFEAKVASKYTVIIENIAFIVFAIVKLVLIYFKAPLIAFGYALAFEGFVVFLGLSYIFFQKNRMKIDWFFDIQQAKYLLSESWPLIISGVAWIIYTKTDQIMIGQMLDDTQVGLYSAASKLSDIAAFLPTVIASSIVPILLKTKSMNQNLYEKRFQQLYYITITLMVGIAILVTFSSRLIISLLYGEDYSASANVLSIHFWIVVCLSLAIVSGKYLVNEGLQRLTMYRHLVGVAINIPLNYLVIPYYGIEGAAVASLTALFTANYIFDIFDKKTRIVFIQKTKALFFWWIYEGFFKN